MTGCYSEVIKMFEMKSRRLTGEGEVDLSAVGAELMLECRYIC